MCITEFFKRLGAPLYNTLWSWGAQAEDGTVILRCWAHEVRKVDGKYQYIVLDESYTKKNGYTERVNHLELIRNGAQFRIVSVTDVDSKKPTGKIKQYKSDALMIGTKVFNEGSKTYVECEGIEKLTNGCRNA